MNKKVEIITQKDLLKRARKVGKTIRMLKEDRKKFNLKTIKDFRKEWTLEGLKI